MIDKRAGVSKKPVKTQEYFPQSNPGKPPKGKAEKAKGK
jgi:hypothetical protein